MATTAAKQSATGNIEVNKQTMAQPYLGVIPLVTGSGNQPNAAALAMLTGTPTTCVYLSGVIVTGSGATTAKPVLVTISGLIGGARNFVYGFGADVNAPNQPLILNFDPPLPAVAVNTAIAVTVPPGGTGNLNSMVTAYGFAAVPAPIPNI
jgi:hypothetical protein